MHSKLQGSWNAWDSNPIFSTVMYYTYVLKSCKDGRFYIGQTQDLEKRLNDHNKGYSKYTKIFRSWALMWYATFDSRSESYILEQKLKRIKSRDRLIGFMKNNGGHGLRNERLL
jgi:putative endonuclease